MYDVNKCNILFFEVFVLFNIYGVFVVCASQLCCCCCCVLFFCSSCFFAVPCRNCFALWFGCLLWCLQVFSAMPTFNENLFVKHRNKRTFSNGKSKSLNAKTKYFAFFFIDVKNINIHFRFLKRETRRHRSRKKTLKVRILIFGGDNFFSNSIPATFWYIFQWISEETQPVYLFILLPPLFCEKKSSKT